MGEPSGFLDFSGASSIRIGRLAGFSSAGDGRPSLGKRCSGGSPFGKGGEGGFYDNHTLTHQACTV